MQNLLDSNMPPWIRNQSENVLAQSGPCPACPAYIAVTGHPLICCVKTQVKREGTSGKLRRKQDGKFIDLIRKSVLICAHVHQGC